MLVHRQQECRPVTVQIVTSLWKPKSCINMEAVCTTFCYLLHHMFQIACYMYRNIRVSVNLGLVVSSDHAKPDTKAILHW